MNRPLASAQRRVWTFAAQVHSIDIDRLGYNKQVTRASAVSVFVERLRAPRASDGWFTGALLIYWGSNSRRADPRSLYDSSLLDGAVCVPCHPMDEYILYSRAQHLEGEREREIVRRSHLSSRRRLSQSDGWTNWNVGMSRQARVLHPNAPRGSSATHLQPSARCMPTCSSRGNKSGGNMTDRAAFQNCLLQIMPRATKLRSRKNKSKLSLAANVILLIIKFLSIWLLI